MIVATFFQGFAIGLSLIVAIGPQNAFLLKQGLLRSHVLLTVCIYAIIDTIMISLGVAGFGTLIAHYPPIAQIARYVGGAFLIYYGLQSLRAAWSQRAIDVDKAKHAATIKRTVLLVLGFSFLNPHLYLDTLVLLGSIGSQYNAVARPYFALGAIVSSYVWFFSLGYGAKLLTPLFKRPRAWQILDVLIAIIMWSIAVKIILG